MSDLQKRLRPYADWLVSCALGNIPEEAATAYEAASRISQQEAELERLRREVEEVKAEVANWRQAFAVGAGIDKEPLS